jgi:hypothetical protein
VIRRIVLTSLVAAAGALALAAPAAAHIDADHWQAQAGSTLTVGVTGVEPEPFEGWTASLETDDATVAETVPAGAPASTDDDAGDEDDSNSGTAVFIISIIAVLIVAALAFTIARRNRNADGGTPADADR